MNTFQQVLNLLNGYRSKTFGSISANVSNVRGDKKTSTVFFTWSDKEWGVPPLRFKVLARNPFVMGRNEAKVSVFIKTRNQFRPLWNNIEPSYMIDLLVSLTSRSANTAEKLLAFYKTRT